MKLTRLLARLLPRKFPAPAPEAPLIRWAGYPPGHFYSPVVDVEAVKAKAARVWTKPLELPGIDFNEGGHEAILREAFPRYMGGFDYPEELTESPDLERYFINNSQFGWLDARALFVLLRHLKPRRMIEIGGGFSSLLTADVNHRFLGGAMDFKCVEPYPRDFLRKPIAGLNKLVIEKVEDLPLDFFGQLQAGDILFIDSSHVSKTGSDVNYLLFEVLPRLAAGVIIHIHDIFLPREYPRDWVIDEQRSWNEQYVVRALLMYSRAFRVYFGSTYAFARFPELVEEGLGLEKGRGYGGSSLWIEKIAD